MPTATASISVEDAVQRRRGDLIELSHSIHAEPELAFDEHRSCAKTQALVAERGFEITAAPGGLDTAFRAEFGSGSLVIGICAEYDALPGIGHACGHNIIAASAVGTALALADVADELGPDGRAARHPRRGGRRRKGVAAQGRHVRRHRGHGDAARRARSTSRGRGRWRCRRSTSTYARPRGACRRRAVPRAQRRRRDHRRAGGDRAAAPAVRARPDGARHRHRRRAGHQRHPRPHRDASTRCAPTTPSRCASSRAGWPTASSPARWPPAATTRSSETEPPYHELTPDKWLADVFRAEMVRLGRTPVAEEVEAALPLGSTDMGNVTQVMPGIHPIVGIDADGASVHQPGFAAAAAGPSADKAVVEGAIMLARTVVEPGRDAGRARPGAASCRRSGWRHEPRRRHRRLAGRPLRRPGGVAQAHPRPP